MMIFFFYKLYAYFLITNLQTHTHTLMHTRSKELKTNEKLFCGKLTHTFLLKKKRRINAKQIFALNDFQTLVQARVFAYPSNELS